MVFVLPEDAIWKIATRKWRREQCRLVDWNSIKNSSTSHLAREDLRLLFLELPLVAAATTIPLLVVPKPPVLIKVPVFRLAEPFQTILTSVFVLENHQNTSKLCLFPIKVSASKLPNGFRQLFHGEVKTFAPDLERTGFEEQNMRFKQQNSGDSTPKNLEGFRQCNNSTKKGLQWWPLICTMES